MDRAEGEPTSAGWLDVTVACSERVGEAFETSLRVAVGATVMDAIRSSGVLQRFSTIDISTTTFGVWGRLATLATELRQGDRVELYRPLSIDPKEARRKRALQLKEASRETARTKARGGGNAGG